MWEWKCRSVGWFVSSRSWGDWQRFNSSQRSNLMYPLQGPFCWVFSSLAAAFRRYGAIWDHQTALQRHLPSVHQEALAWALGALSTRRALHSNTSGAWLPSNFCPMLTIRVSLPPWALPWSTSLLLQSPKCYLNSLPWPQTSALHPFLPQCPAQCPVPCQKLARRALTLAGQGAKQTGLMTPVHMC